MRISWGGACVVAAALAVSLSGPSEAKVGAEGSGSSVDVFLQQGRDADSADGESAPPPVEPPEMTATLINGRIPTSRPACIGWIPETTPLGPTTVEARQVQQTCFELPPDPAAPAAAPAQPQVTQAMVRRAFERVPVPELSSRTQPVDKTLVNFDTIFYVDAQPMTETVTLLGQQVTLFIQPSTYRWDHGDGSEVTTYSPGAAYPSKEIVHRYMKASRTVRHQVSIDWTATFSVNGGPVQPVPGTVTTVGPQTALRISEAAPALSGAHSG